MAKKKSNRKGLYITLLVFVILAALFASVYFITEQTAVSGCEEKLMTTAEGMPIESYNHYRQLSGESFTDSQLEEAGVVERSNGLYSTYCLGVLS